jgi:hypothetical protein
MVSTRWAGAPAGALASAGQRPHHDDDSTPVALRRRAHRHGGVGGKLEVLIGERPTRGRSSVAQTVGRLGTL